ncbi:hypothetical protein A8B75_04720 [Sphingomonadales bacterium EhC05]|nr:hypothetical protein A8B75_04720 [Sphingomonadales bacterium EhC05]
MIITGAVRRTFVDQQLHKGALFGRQFPRGGAFASAQPDNCTADANGLTRAKFQIPGESVPLVQKTQSRNAFGHRCPDLFGNRRDQIFIGCRCFGFFRGLTGSALVKIIAGEPTATG